MRTRRVFITFLMAFLIAFQSVPAFSIGQVTEDDAAPAQTQELAQDETAVVDEIQEEVVPEAVMDPDSSAEAADEGSVDEEASLELIDAHYMTVC